MKRIAFIVTIAAATFSASAGVLRAQTLDDRQVQFGVMGGLTNPAGDLSTAASHSANAGGLVSIATPVPHLRFRVDGQWQQISGKPFGGAYLACIDCAGDFTERNYRMFNATANAVVSARLGARVNAYGIGGLGVYRLRGTSITHQGTLVVSQSSSETRFGFNGGAGLSAKLGHVDTFFEVRFHQLFGTTSYYSDGYYSGGLPGAFQFVPISIGVIF